MHGLSKKKQIDSCREKRRNNFPTVVFKSSTSLRGRAGKVDSILIKCCCCSITEIFLNYYIFIIFKPTHHYPLSGSMAHVIAQSSFSRILSQVVYRGSLTINIQVSTLIYWASGSPSRLSGGAIFIGQGGRVTPSSSWDIGILS